EKKFKHKKPLTIASLTNEGRKAFENYRRQMQDVLK
ncbi:MAG: transcriptional regulator, partial [Promethearchaeota archaeon]